ncbi:MAG TPA: Na-translocating system protein MpsC family protein [Solirubrobacterales bacterium]|nr:Na-translocating system protein MpsC family protein [Solirubrobacterales bacterium]
MNDERASAVQEATDSRISVLAEISRGMVRLYKEQFGRGPTRARSDFAGPDTVICTLEDTFTPAERRLAEMSEHQRLRDTRLYFQHATEEQFCSLIEGLLKRRVRAFISGIDTNNDISAEIFYLEPISGNGRRP